MKIVIIGGGIIGTSIARELAKRRAGEITILEKEPSLGKHASGRNSGVIHSGINQKPGSLKASMCVKGSRLLREHCKNKNVPMNECGTLVVARDDEEEATLARLLEMGKECGVPGLHMITLTELKEREPLAKGRAALLSPTGATVDSRALLESLAEDAKSLGVEYLTETRVGDIQEDSFLITDHGKIRADYIVNCAGLYADKIAHAMGAGREYRIIPFRGDYMEVHGCEVRSMIYRAPDLRYPFLSVHLTRETDGRVLAGPTSDLAFAREAYEKQWHWKETPSMITSPQFLKLISDGEFLKLVRQNIMYSLSKKVFLREIQTLVEGVTIEQIERARSGIRAQMVDLQGKMVMDLLISHDRRAAHVLNAVSPGMTCSLAFAAYMADIIQQYI